MSFVTQFADGRHADIEDAALLFDFFAHAVHSHEVRETPITLPLNRRSRSVAKIQLGNSGRRLNRQRAEAAVLLRSNQLLYFAPLPDG